METVGEERVEMALQIEDFKGGPLNKPTYWLKKLNFEPTPPPMEYIRANKNYKVLRNDGVCDIDKVLTCHMQNKENPP